MLYHQQVSDVVQMYREYGRIPSAASAIIQKVENHDFGTHQFNLRVNYGWRDCDLLEMNSYAKFYRITSSDQNDKIHVDVSSDLMDVSKM